MLPIDLSFPFYTLGHFSFQQFYVGQVGLFSLKGPMKGIFPTPDIAKKFYPTPDIKVKKCPTPTLKIHPDT